MSERFPIPEESTPEAIENAQEAFENRENARNAFKSAEEGMTEIPTTVTLESIEELKEHMRTVLGFSDEEIERQLSGARE